MKIKRNWKARGTRQEGLPATNLCETLVSVSQVLNDREAYEKPYVTQFDNEKPAMFMIISMTINLPRQLALDVSPCHTGAKFVSLNRLGMELYPTS